MRPAGACASSEALLLALGVMTRPGRRSAKSPRGAHSLGSRRARRGARLFCGLTPPECVVSIRADHGQHDGVDELIVNATPHPVGSPMFQVSFGWWLIASRQFPEPCSWPRQTMMLT